MQNAICLYVRTAKNSLPHPTLPGATFPLSAFVALDLRQNDDEKWQGKLTGRYSLTTQDIVTIMEILPGSLPSEAEIQEFIDVAQKRIAPPPGWRWPDS